MKKPRPVKFIAFLTGWLLLSGAVLAQEQKNITLQVTNVPLVECLRSIERQSGYNFIFNDSIGVDKKVTATFNDTPVNDALSGLLDPLGIQWEWSGRHILLKYRESAKTQENKSVSGRVLDQNGDPVVGAIVMEKGSLNGTSTDSGGYYTLEIKPKVKELVVSCLGYSEKTIELTNKAHYVTYLTAENMMLDELVVVGYGSQKKVNLTGAITTVSGEKLSDRVAPTVTHMLQGSVPGLNITTSSGRPGSQASINIRGVNSINGGSPLVLIDGVEGNLSQINPSDIDNISVIKDASSSAIYGARASFGVILVTTKQGGGKNGKATIRYSGRYGWTAPTTRTDYETRGYWSVYINDLFNYADAGMNYTRYTEQDMQELWARRNDVTENPERPWIKVERRNGQNQYIYYANTDWWHYFFQDNSPLMSHNISMTGGSNGIKYYVSGGYDRTEGIFRMNTDINNKFFFRSNISFDLTKWANFSSNTSFYAYDYTYPGVSDIDDAFSQTCQHALASFPPTNPDGTNVVYTSLTNGYNVADSYGAILTEGKSTNNDQRNQLMETVELTLTPLEGLEVKGNFTFGLFNEYNYNRVCNITYSQFPGVIETVSSGDRFEDRLSEVRNRNLYYQLNAYASYTRTFAEKHNIKVMAGYNYDYSSDRNVTARGYYQLSEELNDLNLTGTDNKGERKTLVSGGKESYATEGIFGRFNYDYDGKYLFEFSGRYDGTSRFAKGQRWGFFPSASVGWRISKEPFFKPLTPIISNLKVRYSFGQLGNQQVDNYAYLRQIKMGTQDYLFGGNTKPTTASIDEPKASDLTWEVAQHQNIGLDIAFLDGRLSFTGEAYIRDTKNMLVDGIALPSTYGATSPQMNSADLRSKGYELTLSWKDVFTLGNRPFTYGASAIFSDYVSYVTRFDNPDKLFAKEYWVGYKWGDIWGYTVDGYFRSDEEAANYPVDQTLVNWVLNNAAGPERGLKAGDLKYVDLDGDNKITEGTAAVDNPNTVVDERGDRRVLGNSRPRYNFGLTLDAQYAGFDFSIFFQGIGHMDWYPPASAIYFWGPYVRAYASYIPKDFFEQVWTPENPDAYFPRPRGFVALNSATSELGHTNTKYLQNIGYVRLKNLTAGYTLPSKLTRKAGIEKLRLYFSGENLAKFCPGLHSKYIDPEQAMTGTQMKMYPWRKTIMFGIDITF